MIICDCGGGASTPTDLVAPEIPSLLMQRLPKVESRSFSDSSSRILLLLSFITSVPVSNLAIAVEAAFCK